MEDARPIIDSVFVYLIAAAAGFGLLAWLLSFVQKWARAKHIKEHGEGSLPPAEPPLWEKIPKEDRRRIAYVVGAFFLVGIVLRFLRYYAGRACRITERPITCGLAS